MIGGVRTTKGASMAKNELENTELSNRTVKALSEHGITSLGQVKKLSQEQLEEIKGLGPKSVSEIKSVLSSDSEKSEPAATEDNDTSKSTTKAGKRSVKGQREAAEKAEKEARKQGQKTDEPETEPVSKRGPVPVPKPLIERHGKKYRQAIQSIDKTKEYTLEDAVKLAIAASTTSFDATVELHVRLNVDPKQADQNIRETVVLPHGTGKTVRVAVFAPADEQKKAEDAGADVIGESEIIDKLKKEELDFDVLIATPAMMSQLGQFARILGPKGLMPNPKSGTVTKNVGTAVKEAKAGRIEFRIDKQGIVHVAVGKVSFGDNKILENTQVVLDALKSAKPSSVKTQYVSSIFLTTSMGPSVRIETTALTSA